MTPGTTPAKTADPQAADPKTLAAWAIAGPAALGACVGLSLDPALAWIPAAALPAVVIGVTLLCAPTLYIGAAFAGVAPPPRVVVGGVGRTLADAGRVLAGLLPAIAFLAATASSPGTVRLLALGATALAALVGLRVLYRRLFTDHDGPTARLLFGTWALVYLGIGLHLLVTLLAP